MGDYSVVCGLSGLPIRRNDRVKKIILRSYNPDHLYWIPERKGWQPLLLPITGYYEECHGSIENVDNDPALDVLYRYFKLKDVFCVERGYEVVSQHDRALQYLIKAAKSEEPVNQAIVDFIESQRPDIKITPFTWQDGDWDDFCIQLIEQKPIFQNYFDRSMLIGTGEFETHSYCLVLDEVFQYAINAMEQHREHYTQLFRDSLPDFLCPYTGKHDMKRAGVEASTVEEYFAQGGKTVLEEEDSDHEWLELHARVTGKRGSHNFFGALDNAIAHPETAYVAAAQSQSPELINAIVDMILLHHFTERESIMHTWNPLRTYSIYEQRLDTVHIPWNRFKLELAEQRYQEWREERGED